MKKIAPFLLCSTYLIGLFLLLSGCSQPQDRFIFEGSIVGVTNADFYVYCEDGGSGLVDTIHVKDGKFTYERVMTSPAVLTLLYPNFSQTYIVAEPGTTIVMEGDAGKLGEADIAGTKENELLTRFRQEAAKKNETEARKAAAEFVGQNTGTLAAVAVFRRYFGTVLSPDPVVALPLLDGLRKAQPKNTALALLDNRLRPLLKTAPGQLLPSFSTETIKGDTLTTDSLKGTPAIVAFWSQWNGASNDLLSSLNRLHKTHGDSIQILAVSLDANKARCLQYVRRDSVKYNVVCDKLAFESPLVRLFGVRGVPSSILADKDGRIVARDLEPKNLEERVSTLFE